MLTKILAKYEYDLFNKGAACILPACFQHQVLWGSQVFACPHDAITFDQNFGWFIFKGHAAFIIYLTGNAECNRCSCN